MKKTAPAVILALVMATLAVIGMSCSRDAAPVQSEFAAEQGVWGWLHSSGGLNNEELDVDSVSFLRVLYFTDLEVVEFYEVQKGANFIEPDYTSGYSIDWENVGSERVKVLRYDNDIHVPQIIEFPGRDSLVLTDLKVNGYTHIYFRL
ncbi:MAG: hypothetical protein OEV49_14145 [candidate division Zixibacteria bacterium]|nr:hypothetical protein [candidate division Zixibacteria bacterium]MDH3937504.1 hypothetical protein [candidate division Zixibacteria bacterium]MDH4033664.1 hypothetical protein [candidate division Zixibacteria bacterium]